MIPKGFTASRLELQMGEKENLPGQHQSSKALLEQNPGAKTWCLALFSRAVSPKIPNYENWKKCNFTVEFEEDTINAKAYQEKPFMSQTWNTRSEIILMQHHSLIAKTKLIPVQAAVTILCPSRTKDVERFREAVVVHETRVDGEQTHHHNNVSTSKDSLKHL